MRTGTVKWFNARKGCGVIHPADGGFNVYVKISAVQRAGLVELKEGQKIGFETVSDRRTGETLAENLTLLPNAPNVSALLPPIVGKKASWRWRQPLPIRRTFGVR
jgi:CspA family cold shock protein